MERPIGIRRYTVRGDCAIPVGLVPSMADAEVEEGEKGADARAKAGRGGVEQGVDLRSG